MDDNKVFNWLSNIREGKKTVLSQSHFVSSHTCTLLFLYHFNVHWLTTESYIDLFFNIFKKDFESRGQYSDLFLYSSVLILVEVLVFGWVNYWKSRCINQSQLREDVEGTWLGISLFGLLFFDKIILFNINLNWIGSKFFTVYWDYKTF